MTNLELIIPVLACSLAGQSSMVQSMCLDSFSFKILFKKGRFIKMLIFDEYNVLDIMNSNSLYIMFECVYDHDRARE